MASEKLGGFGAEPIGFAAELPYFCRPFSYSENLRADLQVVLLQMVRQSCRQVEAMKRI